MESSFYSLLIGLGFGAVIGSFLGTLVIRWPQGRSIVTGRSACDGCGVKLTPAEIVPLLSFFIGNGRCRTCGSSISKIHPVMEIGCAIIGMIAMTILPDVSGLVLAIFGWLLLTLVILDVQHLWLPDRVVLPLAVGGLLLGPFIFEINLIDRLIGGLSGFLSMALIAYAYKALRKRDGMGGGDPKLLGAIGLWLGWQQLPYVVLLAASASLFAAVILYFRTSEPLSGLRFPFGAALAASAFGMAVVGIA